ncbi:MAG TPA: M3 family metallopeptidase [Candidatus Sulfotelmatobacter sp.]|jgi:oligoendopeptidase F|nr:M3 family metallopeptidase [Candidatus Sulfotelmatobacter sp.]
MGARILMALLLLSANVAENPTVVAAHLDGREKQLESLYADYWRIEYKIALGNQNLSSRPIQEQIRAVVSDNNFLQDLERASFSDPLLKTRRNLFLNEAVYTRITNDPDLTAVVEQITRQENATRYTFGDRQLTRAEVTDLLAHNPDRKLREQAWRATSQIAAANGERIQSAVKLRNQLAGKYSAELFSTFMLHRKGLEVESLFGWFEQIREATEPEYQRLLERMRHELGVAKIEPWDLEFYFSNFTNKFESQKFSTDEGWTKARQLTTTLGYNLDSVEMHVADLSLVVPHIRCSMEKR